MVQQEAAASHPLCSVPGSGGASPALNHSGMGAGGAGHAGAVPPARWRKLPTAPTSKPKTKNQPLLNNSGFLWPRAAVSPRRAAHAPMGPQPATPAGVTKGPRASILRCPRLSPSPVRQERGTSQGLSVHVRPRLICEPWQKLAPEEGAAGSPARAKAGGEQEGGGGAWSPCEAQPQTGEDWGERVALCPPRGQGNDGLGSGLQVLPAHREGLFILFITRGFK